MNIAQIGRRLAIVLSACILTAPCGGELALGQSLADVPGVVVRSLPTPPILSISGTPYTVSPKVYTASPSIVVLPNGDYVITDNDFGSESTAATSGRTNVFRSTDQGATWTPTATLTDMKRGGLFIHQGAVHLMGYTNDNANDDAITVIRRSTDNGVTWGDQPSTRDNGLFSNGGAGTPNTAVVHDGRIWVAQGGKRVRSIPAAETNLLLTRRWSRGANAVTDGGPVSPEITISEAQIVASPRTGVVVMPKVQQPNTGVLLRVDPSDPAQMLTPTAADWIALPGAEKKFAARYDPVSDRFFVLSNPVLPAHADHLSLSGGTYEVRPWLVRNTAALISSRDLVSWDVEKIFLYSTNVDYEGFQYLQFDYDGDDMVIASRTAFDVGGNKPLRGHDSNLTTFHRIEDFRTARARHVVTISGGGVVRSELTQHDAAPLGSFVQGTTFAGAPLATPSALGQAVDGDVYIAEQAGRVLRFDSLGNFREVVAAAPVTLTQGPLELAPPAAGERTWTQSGGGGWADVMHWHYWNRPDTDAEIVTLGSAITSAATLAIDTAFTMKGIRLRSDHAYTLSGSGSLRLEADAGRPLVRAERGSHVIGVPVTLGDHLDVASDAGAAVMFAGGLDLAGHGLDATGSGAVVIGGGLSGTGSVVVGGGTLVLAAGASATYVGSTTISGGTLLVEGLKSGAGAINVVAGAIGGGGTVAGSLMFSGSAARLILDPERPLTVNGSLVSFAQPFGVANIEGLTAGVGTGIFTLIDGSADVDITNLLNLGPAAAYDLGDGRSAYFEEGSLILHVVPEPACLAPGALALAAAWWMRRQEFRAG